ncbi:hypothetical protein [Bdellovibrio sp. HCB2-146]|uniref:hypothetical protein n=1 Tax=Bdellovibrio sp. HCB2-146 TaxID=3394362 RepID=UPI0039BD6CD0
MENELTPRDPLMKGTLQLLKPSESFHKRVRIFFEEYGDAFLNPELISSFYADCTVAADPSFVGGLKGSREVLKEMKKVVEYQKKTGMRSLSPIAVEIGEIASPHYLAIVTWGAFFEKTGDKLVSFKITYILREKEETFQIIASISHEDERRMRSELGILT